MDVTMENSKMQYNSAKTWQIIFFVLNNTATNIAFFFTMFYAFFSQNVLGLSAAIVGTIAMLMRIFDGITDPIIGFVLDKTNGKFGKFRPLMLLGNIILFITVILIFRTPNEWSLKAKYIYTTILYAILIIGYTFQTACTKSAQVTLTNNPKQRPLFTLFDTIFNIVIFNGGTFLLFTILGPKYPRNVADPNLWKDLSIMFMGISFIFTILAIIGIWEKDRTEYFGLGTNNKVTLKDGIDVIKKNKPLQMLIIAASTDKLAMTAIRGGIIYFFSNILLNSKLQGKFSIYALIPGVIITFIGVGLAKKSGIKKSFVGFTWLGTIMLISLIVITPLLIKNGGANGVLFVLILMALQNGVSGLAGNIVMPMIADCSDYETYRSGKFMPGLIGTVFSFVDKMISSVATFIMGMAIAWAGYGNVKIAPNTTLNSKFDIAIYFIIFGLPLFGHVASLISMRYYDLDNNKMEEIKQEIEKRKQELNA